MAIDPVPWLVGGGAEHSPEVARLLAFAATSGAEGIVLPTDAKVAPLSVPGAGVQVAAGAALIRSRAAGGTSQTYVGRVISPETVAIAATGSGAGRSDLIVLQVEDPFMAGEPWQAPADPRVGPYFRLRVISGIPAGTKRLQEVAQYAGRSAVTLARVDLPASTGTVTAAMITDLRKVALPRFDATQDGSYSGGNVTLTSTSARQAWPQPTHTVEIPEWATHVTVKATIASYAQDAAPADATLWLQLGGEDLGSAFGLDSDAVIDAVHHTSVLVGTRAIPAAWRGTSKTIRIQGQALAARAGRYRSGAGTQVTFEPKFYERPA